MASYRLAAVYGRRPLLNPAFPHLIPEGEAKGPDPHAELLFSAITNARFTHLQAKLNSREVKDKLLLHSRNIAKLRGHGGQKIACL